MKKVYCSYQPICAAQEAWNEIGNDVFECLSIHTVFKLKDGLQSSRFTWAKLRCQGGTPLSSDNRV